MKIETLEFGGFRAAMLALRLSYGKDPRSKTAFVVNVKQPRSIEYVTHVDFDQKDLQSLAPALVRRGDEHAKVLRGIQVWAEITAPVYWFCEEETYEVGRTRLMSSSTMHIDCKGLSGDELVKAKSEIPMGKELTKVDCFSYQTLRRIYLQRKDHRLPEWKTFLDWIETLPYFSELILGEKKEPLDVEAIVKENSING